MKTKPKLPVKPMLRIFLNWVEERQRVHLRRESGEPPPWTDNPILRKYRFCSTYREDDRVTKWIREHWREPYKDHPNLWFAMCIARQINWPDSLEAIGFPETWEPRKVLKILNQRMKAGKKTFTSAYLLGGGNNTGLSKTEYVINHVLNPVWKSFKYEGGFCFKESGNGAIGLMSYQATLQQTWEWLIQFHGWGKFLAYETVTDLRHTRYLCNAPDINTWANAGPGAQRGLNRLYRRELNQSHPQSQLLEELLLLNTWVIENRDIKLLPAWEARDTEHQLCETDKMLRVKEREAAGKVSGLERFHAGLL